MIRLWSFFGTAGEGPSNFRGFPEKPVEKHVENVDNLFYVNITSCYRIYYVNLFFDKTRHAQ